ncbi:hypothetical protein PG996_013449 [Apiospora saccharicola]|uniref:Uncharacterized protein n=1 Tax=Apiospora saccharicola TaxID=335842 RepID=A0ABR1U5I4_9PEZI
MAAYDRGAVLQDHRLEIRGNWRDSAIGPAKDACWQGVLRSQYLEIDIFKDSKSTTAPLQEHEEATAARAGSAQSNNIFHLRGLAVHNIAAVNVPMRTGFTSAAGGDTSTKKHTETAASTGKGDMSTDNRTELTTSGSLPSPASDERRKSADKT